MLMKNICYICKTKFDKISQINECDHCEFLCCDSCIIDCCLCDCTLCLNCNKKNKRCFC